MNRSKLQGATGLARSSSRRGVLTMILAVLFVTAACGDWTPDPDRTDSPSRTTTSTNRDQALKKSTTSSTLSASRLESTAAGIQKELEKVEKQLADVDEDLAKANDALVTPEAPL